MVRRRPFGKTRVLERDDYTCQYCGRGTTQVDHIIPYSYKVDNSMDNLVTCCSECNGIAGSKLFKDFLDKKNYVLDKRLKKIRKLTKHLQIEMEEE